MAARDVIDSPAAETPGAPDSARLRAIFSAMAEGVVVLAPDGTIVDANPAAETILGLIREQLLGKSSIDPSWRVIREDGSPFPSSNHPAMVTLRTGRAVRNQIMGIQSQDGSLRWIRVNSGVVPPLGDGPPHVVATFVDVTEHVQAIEELRNAREDLKAILDNVPARISAWNADLTNRFANRATERQFGIAAGGAEGRFAWEVVGGQRDTTAAPYVEAALAGHRQVRSSTDVQPDGSTRYSEVTYVPMVRSGDVVGFYVLGIDVTELRVAYQRIRELAARLEEKQEEQRREIARMLHEGIAQDLAAARLLVGRLGSSLSADPAGAARTHLQLDSVLRRCIDDLRRDADALWPAALVHLRLVSGLRAYSEEFGARNGLAIHVVEATDFPVLDEATNVLLFRAAQVALTNIVQHANATAVHVTLRTEPRRIVLEVRDDGVGIADDAVDKPGSVGLLSVREKVSARGGTVDVARVDPSGTRFTVVLPEQATGR